MAFGTRASPRVRYRLADVSGCPAPSTCEPIRRSPLFRRPTVGATACTSARRIDLLGRPLFHHFQTSFAISGRTSTENPLIHRLRRCSRRPWHEPQEAGGCASAFHSGELRRIKGKFIVCRTESALNKKSCRGFGVLACERIRAACGLTEKVLSRKRLIPYGPQVLAGGGMIVGP